MGRYWVHSAPESVDLDDDGMRECARGEHCAGRETTVEDGQRITRPSRTYRSFCDDCRNRIVACLDDLPHRHGELADRIGDKTQTSGPRVSGGTSTPPVPLNLGVDELMRQLELILVSWEERVRAAANLVEVSGPRRSAEAVHAACDVLAAHVDTLLGLRAQAMSRSMDIARHEHLPADTTGWVHPSAGWIDYLTELSGAEAGIEVLNLHHRCLGRLGHTPAHYDLISACWVCGERLLRRHDGSAGLADHIQCRKPECREQYLGARLRSLMVEEEAAQRRKHDREWRLAAGNGKVLHGSKDGYGGRT